MSQASVRPAGPVISVVRHALRLQLLAEAAGLRRAGLPVVAIEPDWKVARAMGINLLDARSRGSVSRMAYASVARWLTERPEGQGLAALLAGAGVREQGAGLFGSSIGGEAAASLSASSPSVPA